MAALRKSAVSENASPVEVELVDTGSSFEFSRRTPEEIGAALRDYFKKATESTDDQQAALDGLMKAIDDSRPTGQKIFSCR